MPANLDFPLYLNISLYSILALGALIGFMRGFKKSLFSFITTFIFYVVFFLTVNLAVNYLWTLSLPQLSQLFALVSPELASATSFSEAAPLALEYFAGAEYASVTTNANFLELATGLGIFALKLVYTLIYFTIFFIIYKLLCLIIRAIIFGGSKKNDKYVSKNRGLGLLFGILEGAIALYVTLIIFGGVMSITESLVNLAPVEDTQEVVLEFPRQHLYEASYTVLADSVIPSIPPEISGMIEELKTFTDAYNSNLLVSFSNQLTMTDEFEVETPLNLYLFDEVLSFDYNENQVSIRKELSTFATIGAYVLNMEYVETNDITDITGDNVRDIFELISHSDLVVSILPLGIEIGSIYLEVPLTVPTEELYEIDWQDELTQLGGIAATAFDIVSQIGLLEGDPNFEEIDIDGDTMRDLFGALGDSQLITLAAYVAIEPLLENVGGTVQAVMTLPSGVNWEDIDWKNEFTGLGAILGAVLDTGITYQQATSGDYQVILNAVAQIDFTVLLQSKIVCYSLVNVLSGAAGIEGLDMIVVPDGIEWLIYDEDGVTIIGGELQYILEALSAMTSVLGEIDFENLSPAVLSELSDESIDTIFESRVLVASLSSVLLGIELGDFELIVPFNAVDEDYYILKDEMKSMLKAVKLIMELPECDEETEDCTNLEPDYLANALSLTDSEIDTLLASNILKATVGNLITDMNQDPLVIPNSVLEGVQIAFPEIRREETINIISGDEIKKVIQAVMVFEITDFENMTIDASIISKLEGADTPGVIDEAKLTKIFASGVIHATISDIILELMNTDEPFITVPYFEEDGVTEVRYTEDTLNYISVDELKAVLRALHSVNITDFENVEASLDINAILENVDLLLESAVLQATISKQLLDMSDTIVVPETYFGDVAIQIEVGEVAELTNTTYISSDELENIFDALSVLNIVDINSIQMDASIISNLEDTDDEDEDLILEEISQSKIDTLFGSAIIHATLSDVLLELMSGDSAYVVVPHYGLDELNVEFEILQTYDAIDYIAITELSSALKALYSLDITDFDTIETAITLDVILNNIDELLDSSILHATVSKQLLDMNNDAVIIPVTSLDDDPIQVETGDVLLLTNTTYITRDELRSIFDALDILGISDINAVTFDATIINNLADTLDEDEDLITDELSDAKLATLFSSSIIHATISDMLFDLENADDPYVTVPAFGLDEMNVEISIKETAYSIDYVAIFELEAVLKALYALDISDFDTMEDAITLQVILDNVDVLLESSILHSTVSKQLLDMNNDSVIIPVTSIDDEPIQIETGDVLELTNTTYITRNELRNIFDALEILAVTDINNVTFDATIINNLADTDDDDLDLITDELSDDKLAVLFSSSMIHATISDMLIDLTSGDEPFVVVPEYGIDELHELFLIQETAYTIDYVITSELEAVLKALYALDIDNFDTIEDELTLDVILANIDVLLDSSILHATVSNQILTIEAEMIIVPETYGTGLSELDIRILASDTEYIDQNELRSLFHALEVLGFTDFSVSFDASIINQLEDTDDDDDDLDITEISTIKLNALFDSAIIHASFSKMFFDETVAEGEEAVVVVPEQDYDLLTITYTETNYDYIQVSELKNTIIALHALNITDFNAVDALDMDTIITNLDTLLASAIMHATISNQIISMTDDGYLIVPYFASDDITTIRKTVLNAEYINKDELSILFESMQMLGVTGDLSAFSGSLDYSPFFDETQRTYILGSSIMHVMISDTLITLDPTILTVPFYNEIGTNDLNRVILVVGEIGYFNEYVVTNEINSLFEALDTLGISGDIEDFDGTINLAALFDETERDTILASSIMQLRISKELFDLGTSVLSVPYYQEDNILEVRRTVGSGFEANEYVLLNELNALFDALPILGVTEDIQGFDGEVSLTPLYDETQRSIVLSSSILQGRISKELIDLGSEILVVPYTAADDTTEIRLLTNGTLYTTEYVLKQELGYMFEALELLGISSDIQTFTGLDTLNPLYNPVTRASILDSSIVHAKITDELIKLNDSVLAIPYVAEDDVTLVRQTVGTLGYENEYIVENELNYLFTAIDLLNTEDVNLLDPAFTGDFDLSPLFDETERNTILDSSIIHGKISEELMALGTSILEIPYGKEDFELSDLSTYVVKTVGEVTKETTYVVQSELGYMFDGLALLGFTGDVLAFDGDINLSAFYDPLQRDTILLSSILQAKISKEMFNLGDDVMVVPQTDIDGSPIKLNAGPLGHKTDYIIKTEISNLFDAMGVLGLSGDTNFGGSTDVNLLNVSTLENQTTLLNSASMHATISSIVIKLDEVDNILIVPTYTELGETEPNRIKKTVSLTEFIVKTEVHHLIDALNAMGYSNLGISGSIDSSKFFSDPDTILLSSSIQATFSDKLINDTLGELIIPDTNIDTLEVVRIIQTDVTYIELDEMKALIHALDILGLTDFTTMDFTPASIFSADFDELLLSVSMQATISKNILSGALDQTAPAGSGSLIVPDYFREAILVATIADEQIEKVELKALLTALETLGISDFGGSMNASTVTTMTDANLTTMLLSGSMHVTMDNMLKGNPNIVVPNKAYVGGNLTTSLYDITGLIQANEIKYFILAASTIPGADFTNVDFSYNAIEGLTPAEQTTVLTSMIVRNMVTPDLVSAVNAYNTPVFVPGRPDPKLYDPIPDSFYEDNDNTTFLTSAAILTLIDYLPA
ncbi:MAG: hypothetical protein CVV56_00630 [Tenericutes bacterium HGW-Tenericutes-1]|jgi:hypothetical protein|nr:MAG: hypothetical protein CVV56_00630 [Tenericutes bacterium HGW-Tenericutes-1]